MSRHATRSNPNKINRKSQRTPRKKQQKEEQESLLVTVLEKSERKLWLGFSYME
jgi:hypothetical protein